MKLSVANQDCFSELVTFAIKTGGIFKISTKTIAFRGLKKNNKKIVVMGIYFGNLHKNLLRLKA